MDTKISNIEIGFKGNMFYILYSINTFKVNLSIVKDTILPFNYQKFKNFVKDLVKGKDCSYNYFSTEELSQEDLTFVVKDGIYTHETGCTHLFEASYSSVTCLLTPMIVQAFQEFAESLN